MLGPVMLGQHWYQVPFAVVIWLHAPLQRGSPHKCPGAFSIRQKTMFTSFKHDLPFSNVFTLAMSLGRVGARAGCCHPRLVSLQAGLQQGRSIAGSMLRSKLKQSLRPLLMSICISSPLLSVCDTCISPSLAVSILQSLNSLQYVFIENKKNKKTCVHHL
jgi:hypothetical protein